MLQLLGSAAPKVKVQVLMGLSRIFEIFDKNTIQDIVLPAFEKLTKSSAAWVLDAMDDSFPSRSVSGTPRECANIFKRWMESDCYCPVGLVCWETFQFQTAFCMFWPQPERTLDEQRQSDQTLDLWVGEQHPWCTVKGLDKWGDLYTAYCWAAGLGFAGILLWSAIRFQHWYRAAAGPDQRLQVAIHGLCLASAAVRTIYIAVEAILVDAAPRGSILLEKMGGVLYTAFFSLSAAAFLCTCNHWLRLFDSMDLTQDGEALQTPWYRNPLLLVCMLFLSLEALHDILYLQGGHPVLDGLYFFWLSLISVLAAFLGVRIAWRLYTRLRLWLNADASGVVFKQTLMSSAFVSVSSVLMLILSVIQALSGRFYPWPCLMCWMLGRLLEFVYLLMVLRAVGSANTSTMTSNHSSHGLQDASFAESFSSVDSPSRQVGHGRQPLWITTRWSGAGSHSGQRSNE
eukprot:symbB.v1.2.016272.t2/scaffold1235.1/size130242/3